MFHRRDQIIAIEEATGEIVQLTDGDSGEISLRGMRTQFTLWAAVEYYRSDSAPQHCLFLLTAEVADLSTKELG